MPTPRRASREWFEAAVAIHEQAAASAEKRGDTAKGAVFTARAMRARERAEAMPESEPGSRVVSLDRHRHSGEA